MEAMCLSTIHTIIQQQTTELTREYWNTFSLEAPMSKYSYTTVYEEFTGLKPPEPKTSKPRRRRGYGHPYRMRLNMQDENQPPLENLENPCTETENTFEAREHHLPQTPRSIFRGSRGRKSATGNNHHTAGGSHNALMEEHSNYPCHHDDNHHVPPKVTYKKRRHYSLSSQQGDSVG